MRRHPLDNYERDLIASVLRKAKAAAGQSYARPAQYRPTHDSRPRKGPLSLPQSGWEH